MVESLKLTPRVSCLGAGIYEAGDTDKCYVRLLVTDSGRVLPVNQRVITEEDLLEVYTWGRMEENFAFFDGVEEEENG
jgi:hypothetical protein